jgi:hypothetical protein
MALEPRLWAARTTPKLQVWLVADLQSALEPHLYSVEPGLVPDREVVLEQRQWAVLEPGLWAALVPDLLVALELRRWAALEPEL